jgi:hypothetical protein
VVKIFFFNSNMLLTEFVNSYFLFFPNE